jgi:diguanylate cyclase (GGDEF)-like protein
MIMPNFANTQPIESTALISKDVEMHPLKKQNELCLTLTNTMQNSLNLRETLEHFYHLIQKTIACSGLTYQLNDRRIQYSFGKHRAHNANYNLSVPGSQLGNISLYTEKRFTESELITVESLLGILIPPLRNALLYFDAVEKSFRDPLTKVGNRLAMDEALKRELTLSKRNSQCLSILMLDIDFFKKINDNYGHQTGDKTLKKMARTIQNVLRATDQVFRFGGEEFLVLLSGTGHDDAIIIADRMRREIEKSVFKAGTEEIKVTISIGVSTQRNSDTRESLLERADKALYIAKSNGRNKVESACSQKIQAITPKMQDA